MGVVSTLSHPFSALSMCAMANQPSQSESTSEVTPFVSIYLRMVISSACVLIPIIWIPTTVERSPLQPPVDTWSPCWWLQKKTPQWRNLEQTTTLGPGDLEQTTTLDGRNKLRKLQKSWNICPRDWAGLRIRATLEVMKGKYMFEVEVWSVLCCRITSHFLGGAGRFVQIFASPWAFWFDDSCWVFVFSLNFEAAVKEDRESRRVKVGLLYVCKVWAQLPITRFYPKAPNLEVAFP